MSLTLKRRPFTRFKYAEEFCQELTRKRYQWQMTSKFDQVRVDPIDGETYAYDEFVVDWYEPAAPLWL